MNERCKVVDGRWLMFHCPGCQRNHYVQFGQIAEFGKVWIWNGDVLHPTLSPHVRYPKECEFFLMDGRLNFTTDCNHKWGGRAVDLQPLE